MAEKILKHFTVKYWKQNGPKDTGHFEEKTMKDIPGDTSFLEMLDILNEQLIEEGKEPFVFDHDCREGICGMCSLYINGTPHGKTARGATTCQLYMRKFSDGDVITIEPWRSAGFPVIKDCMVDRSAFDKSSRQAATPPSAPAHRRTPTPSSSPSPMPTKPWTAPAASAAEPAWQPAKTAPPCSLSAAKSASLPSCPKGA